MTKQLTTYLTESGFTGHQAIVAENQCGVKTYLLCDENNMPYHESQCVEAIAAYIDMNNVAKKYMKALCK